MSKSRRVREDVAIARPTIIEFILDETGSMGSYLLPTISGFNTFIKDQREQDGQGLLTLTKFDTNGLKTPYCDLDLTMVPSLTRETFIPGGGTNLRDAIMTRIEALEARLADWPVQPDVLLVALTDGEDNASRATVEQVRQRIEARQEDGWTFVYLGATGNAIEIASALGFPIGNCKQFEQRATQIAMQSLSNSTTVYRTSRATAMGAAERNYFAK